MLQIQDLRKMRRFQEIVAVLLKYGFDEVIQQFDLPGTDLVRKVRPLETEKGTYVRIRCALEDLGPTFVKFGQIMSLRPDLLPGELLAELEKLQDDLPSLPPDEIQALMAKYLGRSLKDVFSVFDVEPLAAASLSQVHKAVLRREGHIVAVKVQRPGIAEQVQTDLDILESICTFLDQKFDDLKTYDLPNLARVIRRHLMKEVNFSTELRNMNIARAYASGSEIYIPKTYDAYSSDKLLVMEFVQGLRFSDVAATPGYDNKRIARQGLAAAIRQILEDGFFHADPHPGNLLVTGEMNLCMIDWGMVGRLTEKDRFELIELLKGVVEKNSDALVRSLLRICHSQGPEKGQRALERDLLAILDTYYAVPIKDMDIGQLLMSITVLIRNHRLQLPTDFIIMIKALVTAEGSARQAYPELNVVAETKKQVSHLAQQRYKPEVLWRNVYNSLSGLWSAQRDVPRLIKQIISKLDTGDLGLRFHIDKLEKVVSSVEGAANRLTIGIITGAIIMGSSMIITTGVGPYLLGFPALGVIGYMVSVVLGLWLVFTILRG